MVNLKTKEEIEIMVEGGRRLKMVVSELIPLIKPGITTKEIDDHSERLIKKYGGEPSFKKVKNYYWSTCLPINEQVVHTIPGSRIVKKGDLLTIDIGFFYKGFHTDYALTMVVGRKPSYDEEKFLETGRQALYRAIDKAKIGNYIGEISSQIEKTIKGGGYYIIKQLTGHGIGRQLHEDPYVLGYVDRPIEKTLKIREGLIIAIEVIYSMGGEEIILEKNDNWSLVTLDKSLSACFEHTVAVTMEGPLILT